MSTAEIRLALTGDVMLGRLVSRYLDLHGPAYVWGNILPAFRAADLRLINLECAITAGGKPWDKWPKAFYFRTSHRGAKALRLAGVDYASLANNHILDFREEGLLDTLSALDAQGISHAGAGANLAEARRPAWLEALGKKIAVFSATDNEPHWAAGPDRPGTNYLEIVPNPQNLALIRKAIGNVRAHGAELVVFSLHWGPNMAQRPSPGFRRFAHELVDAGADIIHGHSAHVVQGVEVYRNKPILYDTGEFIDDYMVDPFLRNDLSFLFTVVARWDDTGLSIPRVELVPILIEECRVGEAPHAEAVFIRTMMIGLCRELGTEVREEKGRLVIEPAAPPPLRAVV